MLAERDGARLPKLPVGAVLAQLDRALAERGAALLVAPPGAGKSTLVPLALLEAPWLADRRILVLQPRRIAARLVARRMAELLGERPGETVGWAVRFERVAGPRTRIEVVTEGVLTRRLQADPGLAGVGLVVLDELHERSLETDLALALLLEVRAAFRPDLRLLGMSATLEAERVAALLGGAPILRAQGRTFPVETRWRPRPRDAPLAPAVAAAVHEALRDQSGDVLVFLPGAREIGAAQEALRSSGSEIEVLPLHGALPRAAQDRALAPSASGRRKVVLATDLAETSLTVEGIGAVVDSGLARRPRYDPRTGTGRLETVRIPLASADQRRGRAGRLGPGLCIRLWAEAEERAMPAHARPEILDADLAPLLLELARWGVRDARALAWLDPPPEAGLAAARRLLEALGAVDRDGRLTETGRAMAELPLHPRLARLVHEGRTRGAATTALALAALLSARDPWRRERDPDLALKLRFLRDGRDGEPASLAELQRIRRQLADLTGTRPGAIEPARAGELLLAAFPDRIAGARPGGNGRFLLASGRGAIVDPTSALASTPFLVVAELDDAGADARIGAAAAIDEASVRGFAGPALVVEEEVGLDERTGAVVARRIERIGAIELASRPIAEPDPVRVRSALLDAIRRRGLDRLPWSPAARALRARIGWLGAREPAQGLPATSDAALEASLEHWLGPELAGIRRLDELARVDLAAALGHLLAPLQRTTLDRLAPPTLLLPSGKAVPIDYEREPPVASVRAQELFGLDRHPSLRAGAEPLVLELLSPAGRPIALTRDLPAFWRGGWAEVRKAMRGRYPKHPWPEEPWHAQPQRPRASGPAR
ncbi:MAG: ATP-dependent helicase HrpB [Geminicoccaceae bacterium]|nr:ATP-dependent helicase HrpB [Geminicoccaceae bacterium]